MTLKEVSIGQTVTVKKLSGQGATKRRIMDMGITKGVTFNSDRLGLGTNLYTDEETLVEKLGFKKLDKELTQHSNYYDKYILYGKKKE